MGVFKIGDRMYIDHYHECIAPDRLEIVAYTASESPVFQGKIKIGRELFFQTKKLKRLSKTQLLKRLESREKKLKKATEDALKALEELKAWKNKQRIE